MTSVKSAPATSPSDNLSKHPFTAATRFAKTVLGVVVGAKRWRWIAARLALFMGIGLLSILFAAVVTPGQSVNALGQHFTISAASPSWSLTGPGEITVNTGTPQTFYLLPTKYYGPVRVHLTVDAPFQGSELLNKAAIDHKLPPQVSDEFAAGFKAWLLYFALIALATGSALGVGAAFLLLWFHNSRRRQATLLLVRSVAATAISLTVVTVLFVMGSTSISGATSLDGLVGHSTLHLSPVPMGPKLNGYDAVSIGDSRAATQGGKDMKNPSKEDSDCRRSSDSLAAQIGRMENWRVLNLACSAATVTEGLMGGQSRGGRTLIPQISAVKQMTDVKAVFVTIGPNDLWWSRAIGLCYLADVCNDNLTTPGYQALLEKFKWNYHDLLVELQGLHNGPDGTQPLVIINGSYDVVKPGDSCSATKGLTPEKIAMLGQRNEDLNEALRDGAGLFGFSFVKPRLKTLCDDLADSPGPDIRKPTDHDAFHPTDTGVMVIAAADVAVLATARAAR
jgi:lysophospholipase L1-like esterase